MHRTKGSQPSTSPARLTHFASFVSRLFRMDLACWKSTNEIVSDSAFNPFTLMRTSDNAPCHLPAISPSVVQLKSYATSILSILYVSQCNLSSSHLVHSTILLLKLLTRTLPSQIIALADRYLYGYYLFSSTSLLVSLLIPFPHTSSFTNTDTTLQP